MTQSPAEKIDLGIRHLLAAWEARGTPKERTLYGTRLADEPLVFVMWDYTLTQIQEAGGAVWDRWRGLPVMIILLQSWELSTPESMAPRLRIVEEHHRLHSGHRLVFAANSAAERTMLENAGIEAVHCSSNALINEHAYQPKPGAQAGDEREFDAVYDARFARYKRHQLAARVRRIALIHYTGLPLFEPLWWAATRWRMRHGRIVNRHKWGFWPQWIDSAEVSATYNRARTGLCLSALEGAMLASTQYLLCGVPVVTTPSRGGRDAFFDSENSVTVEPTAEAVAAGVQAMIERRLDPWTIRARTLERMTEHRNRLIAFVEIFQREHGVPEERLLSAEWPQRIVKAGKGRLT